MKPNDPRGWIGVDLDGTLADYSAGWQSATHIGAPVPAMLARVKRWLAEGRQVRIFTARVWPITTVLTWDSPAHELLFEYGDTEDARSALVAAEAALLWTREHLGVALPVTCVKDKAMIELYDDRCVQVVADTGELVGESSRGVSP